MFFSFRIHNMFWSKGKIICICTVSSSLEFHFSLSNFGYFWEKNFFCVFKAFYPPHCTSSSRIQLVGRMRAITTLLEFLLKFFFTSPPRPVFYTLHVSVQWCNLPWTFSCPVLGSRHYIIYSRIYWNSLPSLSAWHP